MKWNFREWNSRGPEKKRSKVRNVLKVCLKKKIDCLSASLVLSSGTLWDLGIPEKILELNQFTEKF